MSIGSQKSGIVQSSLKVVECHAPIVTDTITAARLFLRNDNLHSLKPHPRIASRNENVHCIGHSPRSFSFLLVHLDEFMVNPMIQRNKNLHS